MTPDPLTDEVLATLDAAPPRLRSLLRGLVEHLHALVVEEQVTTEEWRAAIDFLTRTGAITTATRQEFVLLSDVLGVSSLVDRLEAARRPDATPSAVLGPFYVEGPPELPHGADVSGGDLPGDSLLAELRVVGVDGAPVADAVVDVWQANTDGYYDVQLPDQDGPVLRGRFRTDAEGRLRFWTILPAPYPIPTDGPVGDLLGATGRSPMRAPHLHVMIAAPGLATLVTQLFVEGGDHLDSDAVFGVQTPLVVPFSWQDGPAPDGREGSWRRVDYTFRLGAGAD